MHLLYKNETTCCDTRSVFPVPFFNNAASDINTIYTTLLYASNECEKLGQKTCIVTFDQPLYRKAVEIVSAANDDNALSNVVVAVRRISPACVFLGTIGHIMSGSGLEELWGLLYAQNTIVKIMSGHAFSRSLREHFLTLIALHMLF